MDNESPKSMAPTEKEVLDYITGSGEMTTARAKEIYDVAASDPELRAQLDVMSMMIAGCRGDRLALGETDAAFAERIEEAATTLQLISSHEIIPNLTDAQRAKLLAVLTEIEALIEAIDPLSGKTES